MTGPGAEGGGKQGIDHGPKAEYRLVSWGRERGE